MQVNTIYSQNVSTKRSYSSNNNASGVSFGLKLSPPGKDWLWLLESGPKDMLWTIINRPSQDLATYTFHIDGLQLPHLGKSVLQRMTGKIQEMPQLDVNQKVKLSVSIHDFPEKKQLGEHTIMEVLGLLFYEEKRIGLKKTLVKLFNTMPISTRVERYEPKSQTPQTLLNLQSHAKH